MSRNPSPHTERATFLGTAGVSLTKRRKKAKMQPPAPVPTRVFLDELQRAKDPETATGLIALDQSDKLGMPMPATTPTILSYYAVIAADEKLETRFRTGLEFYYVLEGSGRTSWGDESIEWQAGDLFFLPGGNEVEHAGGGERSLLYVLTDEPLCAFLGLRPIPGGSPRFEPTHYLGEELARHQKEIYDSTADSGVVHFGVGERFAFSSILPAWKWIKPGEQQQPHRHAAVAVQIFVDTEGCRSVINGQGVEWQRHAVAVSPAGSLHSHHNDGDAVGSYLVAQDFPLYKYLRTYWHEEPETGERICDWLGSATD